MPDYIQSSFLLIFVCKIQNIHRVKRYSQVNIAFVGSILAEVASAKTQDP